MSESTKQISLDGYTPEIAKKFNISRTEYSRIENNSRWDPKKAYEIWENEDWWFDEEIREKLIEDVKRRCEEWKLLTSELIDFEYRLCDVNGWVIKENGYMEYDYEAAYGVDILNGENFIREFGDMADLNEFIDIDLENIIVGICKAIDAAKEEINKRLKILNQEWFKVIYVKSHYIGMSKGIAYIELNDCLTIQCCLIKNKTGFIKSVIKNEGICGEVNKPAFEKYGREKCLNALYSELEKHDVVIKNN